METRLTLNLANGASPADADLERPLAPDAQAALRAMHYLAGTLRFVEDGQPTVEIIDDLAILLPSLGVAGRACLARGEPTTVKLFTEATEVHFAPQGDQVSVTTSWGVTAVYPRAALLDGLRVAVLRYLRLLECNLAEQSHWQEQALLLRATLADLGETDARPPRDETPLSDEEMARIEAAAREE